MLLNIYLSLLCIGQEKPYISLIQWPESGGQSLLIITMGHPCWLTLTLVCANLSTLSGWDCASSLDSPGIISNYIFPASVMTGCRGVWNMRAGEKLNFLEVGPYRLSIFSKCRVSLPAYGHIKKQLGEAKVYLGSQFKYTACHGGQSWWSSVGLLITCTCSQNVHSWVLLPSSLSPFYSAQDQTNGM